MYITIYKDVCLSNMRYSQRNRVAK